MNASNSVCPTCQALLDEVEHLQSDVSRLSARLTRLSALLSQTSSSDRSPTSRASAQATAKPGPKAHDKKSPGDADDLALSPRRSELPPADEIARRAEAIYEREIRHQVEA